MIRFPHACKTQQCTQSHLIIIISYSLSKFVQNDIITPCIMCLFPGYSLELTKEATGEKQAWRVL